MDKSKYEQGDRGLGKGELHCLGQSNKRSSFASHSIYKIQTQKDVAHAYNMISVQVEATLVQSARTTLHFPLGTNVEIKDAMICMISTLVYII